MIRPTDADIGQVLIYAPNWALPIKRGKLVGIVDASKPVDKKVVVALSDGHATVSVNDVRWADKRRARADLKLQDILFYLGFGAMLIGALLISLPVIVLIGLSVPSVLKPYLSLGAYIVGGGFLAIITSCFIYFARGEMS